MDVAARRAEVRNRLDRAREQLALAGVKPAMGSSEEHAMPASVRLSGSSSALQPVLTSSRATSSQQRVATRLRAQQKKRADMVAARKKVRNWNERE